MKKLIIRTIITLTIATTTILTGCTKTTTDNKAETSVTIEADTAITTASTAEEVQDLADDSLNKWDNTEVYFIRNEDDFDALTPILENRNGKIIIEVIEGIVLDSSGSGTDACGYYIHYDMDQFSVGDHVQSVFVYNPGNNALDDILYRVDTLIE